MAPPSPRVSLLRRRVHVFSRLLDQVEQGDVRALHRTRVASRRLRELLPLLQLDRDVSRRLSRRLRRVTSSLGNVRELDVLISRLDELHESGRFQPRVIDRIAADMAAQRSAAREEMTAQLPIGELTRIASRLCRIAEAARDEGDRGALRAWRWAVDARIARRAAALAESIQHAGAVYLPERLHEVRIALKKLRYAVELAAEGGDAKRHDELPMFKRGQDLLGRLHDLQVLVDRLRQLQAATAPDADRAFDSGLDDLVSAMEDDCRRLHAEYIGMRAALRAACDRVSPHAARAPRPSARRAG